MTLTILTTYRKSLYSLTFVTIDITHHHALYTAVTMHPTKSPCAPRKLYLCPSIVTTLTTTHPWPPVEGGDTITKNQSVLQTGTTLTLNPTSSLAEQTPHPLHSLAPAVACYSIWGFRSNLFCFFFFLFLFSLFLFFVCLRISLTHFPPSPLFLKF